jgi:hypothetical protein
MGLFPSYPLFATKKIELYQVEFSSTIYLKSFDFLSVLILTTFLNSWNACRV